MVLFFSHLEKENNICHLLAIWDLSRFPRVMKNKEKYHDDIRQLFEYAGINPIEHHRFICIQMEQQIIHKFRVGWEFIPTVTVFQLGAPWRSEPVASIEDKGVEDFELLCIVSVPN